MYRNNYEAKLVATLDRKRAKDTDSLFKPFKMAFESRQLSDIERGREPVVNPTLLAHFLCVHSVPYLFRDTNLGCKRCGSYTPKKKFVASL